ncbi:hypothetical protein FCR2A7T_26020 [Flavobacterium cauense R2A-7]|nr:hypothetical protein FCR2A7T_26020 [Flavobacterium cauense R2A-7]
MTRKTLYKISKNHIRITFSILFPTSITTHIVKSKKNIFKRR